MKEVFKTGELVNNYHIDKYLKTSDDGGAESYFVTMPSGKRGLLKLFSVESVSRSMEYGISAMLTTTEGNIAKVLDSGMIYHGNNYYHYLVREVVEGERLSDKLSDGKSCEWEDVSVAARQILGALKHLHTMRPTVLHNSLTLRNILCWSLENGVRRYMLIGLGHLSTPIDEAKPRNIDITTLNPVYLAPEALEGTFNEQTDIFSVGVIMYRMLTGHEPWSLPNKMMSVARVRMLRRTYGDNPMIALPEKYRGFFQRILALEPTERFANVDEVIEAIDELFLLSHKEITEERKRLREEGDKFRKQLKMEQAKRAEEERQAAQSRVKRRAKRVSKSQEDKRVGGFSRVAGLEEVKSVLRRNVMFVMQNEEKAARYGLKAPNGILLYGPPGCGKTFVAEMFAEESELNFMMIKGSDLGSVYIHGTQGKIAELFDKARAMAPAVICFDELDGMAPNRANVNSELSSSEVNEFLSQLNNCSERGILVIGTTNRPEKIDPAVLRTGRMDKILYVDMPNLEARKELFRLNIGDRYVDDTIDYEALAKVTEGYVASDIYYIVNEAALTAAIDDVPLSQDILLAQIAKTRSSVSKDEVAEFEHMRQRYESQNGRLTSRRKIGFANE